MTTDNTTKLRLTKSESLALKGIALLLLLIHHLFYTRNGLYDDIYYKGYGLINYIGIACKVCVPLFVFLSGYGLTAAYAKTENINWRKFYVHRFTKLYLNYWLIWLLFVPLGVIGFGRSFEEAYGGSDIFGCLIADLTGTINIFGKLGYNATWWFYSCIILLYGLFPAILAATKKSAALWIMIVIAIGIAFLSIVYIQPIRYYLITFILGCLFCNGLIHKLLPPPIRRISNRAINGDLTFRETVVLLAFIVMTVIVRMFSGLGLLIDTLIAILIIIAYKNIKSGTKADKSLQFLGIHSFNIFLFHTFIYFYFFESLIYWNRNPVVIFITLLAASVLVSMLIEYLKNAIKFDRIARSIESRL